MIQAGATGARPQVTPTGSPSALASCAPAYRVAFVTDVGGLRADRAAYNGVTQAIAKISCGHGELITSLRPSDYRASFQRAVSLRSNLVIADSFLLTDAVLDAARANPGTRFILIDPIVAPADLPNLLVIRFRDDQSAFLAGALAAMLTQSGVVAGVYGPAGASDLRQRAAFEHGARFVRPSIPVLGAYQPADDGAPYQNPMWGAAEARVFASQRADVIFGGAGATGAGALKGVAAAGQLCIGADVTEPDPGAPSCLVATTTRSITRGVELEVLETARGSWVPGKVDLGLREGTVGLDAFGAGLRPEMQRRLQSIVDQLVAGTVTTGV